MKVAVLAPVADITALSIPALAFVTSEPLAFVYPDPAVGPEASVLFITQPATTSSLATVVLPLAPVDGVALVPLAPLVWSLVKTPLELENSWTITALLLETALS